jgi:uncharacterized SAM-binding protein YcdF (DUF218 family)
LYLRLATTADTSQHFLIYLGIGLGFFLILAILLFGFVALLMFLFINAFIVRKKESGGLSNRLTLLVGIFILLLTFVQFLVPILQHYGMFWSDREMPVLVQAFSISSTFILVYYFMLFASFLLTAILYNMHKPKFDKEYVIVLGAGLLEGRRVTPLLRQRIQCGIDFANKQKEVTGVLPKVIMSGGQGADELVSEAFAMKEAACEMGFPESSILLEDKSTTTFENMKFSKNLLEEDGGNKNAKVVIATNNYHLLRAAIYSRMAGLNADGVGSKTAKYFVPNAFLREFVAQVLMNKKIHLVITVLIFVITLLMIVLPKL